MKFGKSINIELNTQIIKLNKYYKICNKHILINKKKFKKIGNPKISIISPIYNCEKFLKRFIISIQNNFFDEIEIILVDDNSKENSFKIIKENIKNDERIRLLKLKKNKGTLISRNIGVLTAKGKFLMFPDVDDIIANDVLKLFYDFANNNKIELIRYNFFNKDFYVNEIFSKKGKNIYQPELSIFLYYGLGYLQEHDYNICNKFIKRELFIRSLNSINIYYLKKYMIYFEDGLINYSLHLNAKNLYLFNHIGYFYIFNKFSITNKLDKRKHLKCFILFLKYIFENTNYKLNINLITFLLNAYKRNYQNNTDISIDLKILWNNKQKF